MELFTARTCPYAHRTRLALLEKGFDCAHVEVDFQNKTARFLAVSPYGKVPALAHDGHTIYESLIINEYLDEVFPEPRLMPADPVKRAKARIWAHYCDNYYVTDTSSLVRTRDPEERRRLVGVVQDRMRFMETEGLAKLSGDGPYWFGAEVSLLEAHELLNGTVGPNHDRTRRTQGNLARLYEAWGNPNKAAEYRAMVVSGDVP